MKPSRATVLAPYFMGLVLCMLMGCAAPLSSLTYTAAFDSDAALSGATHVIEASEISLGAEAEVYLYPERLWLNSSSAESYAPHGELRLQVVVRLVREDGGVIQWLVGARRDAPQNEGGLVVRLTEEVSTVEFGGMRLGPVRVSDVTGLQVFVTVMPQDPQSAEHFSGAAGLPLKVGEITDPGMAKVARSALASQSTPTILASHLDISHDTSASDGQQMRWVWLSGPGLSQSRRNGIPLAWAQGGEGGSGLSARFMMSVETVVEAHEPERPPRL